VRTYRAFNAWVATIVVGLGVMGADGAAPNIERGARIYDICGACHGARGEGMQSLAVPPLAGQQASYLLRQLRDFKSGSRGGHGDVQAQEMRQILVMIDTETDWQSVIAYVQTLPGKREHEPSRSGDIARGRTIYRLCAACHGSTGEGNETVEAPDLAILPSWYIGSQIRKFRDGIRGAAVGDVPGARMRSIALTMQSGDIAAVTAYIAQGMPR
jgi:cytochrome c oxidase subunit II